MDFTHYQSSKLLGPSPPNKHGVSRESGTDFWAELFKAGLRDNPGLVRDLNSDLKA